MNLLIFSTKSCYIFYVFVLYANFIKSANVTSQSKTSPEQGLLNKSLDHKHGKNHTKFTIERKLTVPENRFLAGTSDNSELLIRNQNTTNKTLRHRRGNSKNQPRFRIKQIRAEPENPFKMRLLDRPELSESTRTENKSLLHKNHGVGKMKNASLSQRPYRRRPGRQIENRPDFTIDENNTKLDEKLEDSLIFHDIKVYYTTENASSLCSSAISQNTELDSQTIENVPDQAITLEGKNAKTIRDPCYVRIKTKGVYNQTEEKDSKIFQSHTQPATEKTHETNVGNRKMVTVIRKLERDTDITSKFREKHQGQRSTVLAATTVFHAIKVHHTKAPSAKQNGFSHIPITKKPRTLKRAKAIVPNFNATGLFDSEYKNFTEKAKERQQEYETESVFAKILRFLDKKTQPQDYGFTASVRQHRKHIANGCILDEETILTVLPDEYHHSTIRAFNLSVRVGQDVESQIEEVGGILYLTVPHPQAYSNLLVVLLKIKGLIEYGNTVYKANITAKELDTKNLVATQWKRTNDSGGMDIPLRLIHYPVSLGKKCKNIFGEHAQGLICIKKKGGYCDKKVR